MTKTKDESTREERIARSFYAFLDMSDEVEALLGAESLKDAKGLGTAYIKADQAWSLLTEEDQNFIFETGGNA